MKSYQLRIIVGEDFDQSLKIMYYDIERAGGFFIADEQEIDGEIVEPIIIFIEGDSIVVMPDPAIKKFLMDKFVKDAVKYNSEV